MRLDNQQKDKNYVKPECKEITFDMEEMILQTSNPYPEDALDGSYL